MMEKEDIDKLRALSIEEVARRLGMEVNRHKAICPFHPDKHPSLTFNVAKNSFKCYVCMSHGGVIDLAMKVLNKNFVESCQWLANENNILLMQPVQNSISERKTKGYGLDLEFLESLVAQPQLNDEARAFLFDERQLHPDVITWLGISSINYPAPCWRHGRNFYDAPSLLIPYRNLDGKLLSVQSRYLGKEMGVARFRFPRGSHCHIFNLPILRLLQPGEPLYISEGVSDCMALMSAGHKAIAIPSATLLNREDIKLLKEIQEQKGPLDLHMYPDADVPGERLYLELVTIANQLGACMTRHSLAEGCKDFGEMWRRGRWPPSFPPRGED